jgi:hypothetical protein
MYYFSNLFDKVLYMFRTRPLPITVYRQEIFVILVLLASASVVRTCPKHVEYFIK